MNDRDALRHLYVYTDGCTDFDLEEDAKAIIARLKEQAVNLVITTVGSENPGPLAVW